jgi:mono/diheme cytochrome c family protein
MRRPLVHPWALLAVLAGPFPGSGRAEQPAQLAAQAQTILQTNCFRCHGKDGKGEYGFDYVLDVPKMIERKKITPREPARSRLFQRVSSPDDPMPPEDVRLRPSKDDIAVLKAWIEAVPQGGNGLVVTAIRVQQAKAMP